MLPYTKPPLPSDLKVWWEMKESSGDAVDSVGGNNALQQGTVPSVTLGGKKCRGDYTHSNYFNFPTAMLNSGLIYQLGNIWSLEFDIWMNTYTEGYAGLVLWEDAINSRGFDLSTNSSSPAIRNYIVANRSPLNYIVANRSPLNYLVGAGSIAWGFNSWNNVAIVSDGTYVKTYINNFLSNSEQLSQGTGYVAFTITMGRIGYWPANSSSLANGYFKNIKIWNTAKTHFPTVV